MTDRAMPHPTRSEKSFSHLKLEIDGLLFTNEVIGTAALAQGRQARRNARRRNGKAVAVTLWTVLLVGALMAAALRFLG